MTDAFAWIGQLVEWFGRFIPRWEILDTTEGALKYVRGKNIVVCSAGVHWWWPLTSKWVAYPTARQTDRLETQTMESADGKAFIVGAMVTYDVNDLEKLGAHTYSPTRTIIDIAMTAVHDVCGELTWDELTTKQTKGTLKTALRNEAQKQLTDFGVRVIKLQLTSLARARVYKISQSTGQEEN